MFETFRKYIVAKVPLTAADLDLMQAVSVTKKLRKRQYLLQEGEVCRYNAFITQGCLRQYRVGPDSTEHIMRFGIENWWMSDRESLNSGQPAKSYIDALEDSEVLLWTEQNWLELTHQIPLLDEFRKTLLARSFDAKEERIHAAISYTAEERYENFLKSYPAIFNRVPLHMIASYLGISRETLSRIRKHIAQH